MKTCPQCKQTKPFSDYNKNRARKDGLYAYCKECKKEQNKEYYAGNRNRLREHQNEYGKRPEIRERKNKRQREDRINNPQTRLNEKISQETRYVLLGFHPTNMSIVSEQYGIDKVGLTSPQYRAYIESLWKEGMSWDNYGHGKGKWTIDHIIPKSHFDLTDPEQYKKCSHYTNTQPMWYEENVSKGDRLLLLAS